MNNNFLEVQKIYNALGLYLPKIFSNGQKNIMHRMVFWDSKDKVKAASYIDLLLTIKAETMNALKVLDLGSGQGETLAFISLNTRQRREDFYVEESFSYYGIVSSVLELQLSNSLFVGKYNIKNCRTFLGDFHEDKSFRFFKDIDLIYAIESLSYSYDLEKVIENVSKALRVGGEFVICDSFFNKDVQFDSNDIIKKIIYCSKIEEESFINMAAKYGLKLIDKIDFTKKQRINSFNPFAGFLLPTRTRALYKKIFSFQRQISYMLRNDKASYLFLNFKKEY